MTRRSAGLLLYRESGQGIEVLLVHPGGPYWAAKDEGAWSIPKGEYGDVEDPLAAARREFEEETGTALQGDFVPLEPVRQPGGKVVQAWAVRGDFDPATLRSGTFTMEWPPRSGRERAFPEVDRAAWLTLGEARRKILKGQAPFLFQLEEMLARSPMATKLDKPLKRELAIDGEPYMLTISPEGLKLVAKGRRKGRELSWKDLVSGDAALATALNASLDPSG